MHRDQDRGDISPASAAVIEHPSRRGRSSRGKSKQRLILGIALGLTLIILFLTTLYFVTEISRLTALASTLRVQLEKDEQELSRLRPLLEKTKSELDSLVKGRFPHLTALEPDKVLNVNQGYVKNVVFNVVRQGRDKKFEYKLVMENLASHEIRPEFKIVVFDKLGVQIGQDEVSQPNGLMPGESRSYSSALRLFMDAEPAYFYLNGANIAPVKAGS